MKKLLLCICIIFSFFSSLIIFSNITTANDCNYEVDEKWNIMNAWKEWGVVGLLWKCLKWSWVVEVDGEATIEKTFKDKINKWTNNIALFLGLLSIGSVIYGGLMMTLSAWEDEKITKAKDIVKWSLVGLLGVILATTIVTLVSNLIYWLGS